MVIVRLQLPTDRSGVRASSCLECSVRIRSPLTTGDRAIVWSLLGSRSDRTLNFTWHTGLRRYSIDPLSRRGHKMNCFSKLHDLAKGPPDLELEILRLVPTALALGTVLIATPSIVARLSIGPEVGAVRHLVPFDVLTFALLLAHWTAVFVVSVGALIIRHRRGCLAFSAADNPPSGAREQNPGRAERPELQ